jgi:hypothetical protein
MFHVKHFGTIGGLPNTLLEGAARYESGIWCKWKSGVGFNFSFCFFEFLEGAAHSFERLVAMSSP